MSEPMFEMQSCPVADENQLDFRGLRIGPPENLTRAVAIRVFHKAEDFPGTVVVVLTEKAVRKLCSGLEPWLDGKVDVTTILTNTEMWLENEATEEMPGE